MFFLPVQKLSNVVWIQPLGLKAFLAKSNLDSAVSCDATEKEETRSPFPILCDNNWERRNA